MRIHLAEASKERGQYRTLTEERYTATLFSYAYPLSCSQYAPPMWDELMQIHLAGQGPFTIEAKSKENVENVLATYAYPKEVNDHTPFWQRPDLRPRVIIDSGAFTAWSTGKVISPRDYAEWALDFDSRWRHKMASLEFMNLDVIGDQDATWRNLEILQGLGMNPLPIVTFGVDLKHLDRAIENYDYIALGGLVPYSRDKIKLRNWLDACFSRIIAYRKKTGTLRKIHLLGITTDWVLKRYPCYSSDSSTWVSCLRFGGGTAAGIKSIPRYKESDAAMAATIHTLRSEIRKYKKMQDEATNLWAARGVIWDD